MDNHSNVNNSGNSDVDVTVNVDTTSLAYAYGCYLHASGQLSDAEFNTMVSNLDRLLKRDLNQHSKTDKTALKSKRYRRSNKPHVPSYKKHPNGPLLYI